MAKVVAAQRARLTPEYNYDIRPAVLKSISVKGAVKANLKNAQAVVSLKMVDNLTGVDRATVSLISPSGEQQKFGAWQSPFPQTRDHIDFAIDMDDVSENGEWRVAYVNVEDANGNGSGYDEAALAALGETRFNVSGGEGDRLEPSALQGGVNLTPQVSRSTPPRGMLPGTWARTGVRLNVADLGSSGVRGATMEFCSETSEWDCFTVSGTVSARGVSSASVVLGGAVYDYVPVGRYRPYSLYLSDFAGNTQYLARYNGDTLDELLDNPVIVITE